MKIIIEDGLSTIVKTGVGQYSAGIEKLIKELGYEVITINKDYLIKIKNTQIRRFLYTIWMNTVFQLKLLFIKGGGRKTALFTNTNTPFARLTNTKYVSFVHDIRPFKIPEQSASKFINYYEKQKVIDGIKRADRIVTVSDTVRKETAVLFKLDENSIAVINNHVSEHFKNFRDDIKILERYNISDKKYLLSVSTRQKWKNMPLIIKAFEKLSKDYPGLKLVLAGRAGNDKIENANPDVIFTGYIEDKIVPVLYKHAFAYVSPSSDEGFGLPVIEAQYSGIPLVCADIPVYREVAGEGACFCPIEADKFYEALKKLSEDKQLYSQMIEKGKINVERYSEENIKKQIQQFFNNEKN